MTRKRKLLEKQKEGKKRMEARGKRGDTAGSLYVAPPHWQIANFDTGNRIR